MSLWYPVSKRRTKWQVFHLLPPTSYLKEHLALIVSVERREEAEWKKIYEAILSILNISAMGNASTALNHKTCLCGTSGLDEETLCTPKKTDCNLKPLHASGNDPRGERERRACPGEDQHPGTAVSVSIAASILMSLWPRGPTAKGVSLSSCA